MAGAHAGLAVPGARAPSRSGANARASGGVLQCHVARLCRSIDGDCAGPVRRRDQPGAALAAEQSALAASLRSRDQRAADLARAICPPDHLLREVFETCRDFAEAKLRLETMPIARPVIFTLVGCAPGERCVIERTEQGFTSRIDETSAANDWRHARRPWEARVNPKRLLRASYEEAAAKSRARCAAVEACPQSLSRTHLAWLVEPVFNPYTRCAIEMCPACAILRVAGFELMPGDELPRQVTVTRTVTGDVETATVPA